MRKAGMDPSERSTTFSMELTCDAFFFVKAAIDRRGLLSSTALREGLESMGSQVPSATTWTTFLGPKNHAGTNGLRDVLFDTACSCLAYASKVTYTV